MKAGHPEYSTDMMVMSHRAHTHTHTHSVRQWTACCRLSECTFPLLWR